MHSCVHILKFVVAINSTQVFYLQGIFVYFRFHIRFFLYDMDKLKSAAPILAGVVTTVLRLPVFYIFEKIYFSTMYFSLESVIWYLYGKCFFFHYEK